MSEIKRHTEAEFAEIDHQIKAAEAEAKRLRRVRAAMVGEHWGCAPGTEVISGGRRFLVVSIDETFGGVRSQPWLKARKQKKDGTFSESEQTIHRDWELAPDTVVAEPT